MPDAVAKVKKAAEKAAVKKLAANGVTKPKHLPGESAPGVRGVFPASTPRKSGVDSNGGGVVQSSVDSSDTTTTTTGEATMAKKTPEAGAPAATPAAGAAGSRTDPAKIAAKAEALERMAKEKAEKKAKADADKEAAKKEKAEAAAKAKTERDAKAAAALEARKAAAAGTDRTYFGSMTALAERVKSGVYTKGLTGQLRSSDELAIALDAVPTDNVIKLGMEVLGLTVNPYAALNRGQQSMNLRNKMRGAIKANEGAGLKREDGTVVTLDYIKSVRDANNYATAEDAAAKRAEAKKVKAEAAAAAKAAKEVEKAAKVAALAQAAAADKAAKEAQPAA